MPQIRPRPVSLLAAVAAIFVLDLAPPAHAAPCVLGNSLGYREFSMPRNSTCIIRRYGVMGMKLVSMRVTVKPKKGRFGSASIGDLAYQSGNVAGDDYFEYVSTQSLNGGPPRDYPTRNVVHITP